MPNLWGVVAAGTLRMHDEGVFAHFSSEHACVNRVHANSIAFACKFQGCRLVEQRYSTFVIEESGSCCKPTIAGDRGQADDSAAVFTGLRRFAPCLRRGQVGRSWP